MKEWNETYKTAAAVHEERENSCSFRFYLIYFTILRVLLECLILILIEREREKQRECFVVHRSDSQQKQQN